MVGETYVIPLRSDADLVLASDLARRYSEAVGLTLVQRESLRTAVAEITHNALRYAGGGELEARWVCLDSKRGVQVIVRDKGPGLPSSADTEIMVPSSKTGRSGLGEGLAAARRLVDELALESSPSGTTVSLTVWARLP